MKYNHGVTPWYNATFIYNTHTYDIYNYNIKYNEEFFI